MRPWRRHAVVRWNPLTQVLQEADKKRVAVGHFSFSELVVLQAVAEAASELVLPVVMGVPESEREFLAVRQAVALVQCMREEKAREIFLNADHTHSNRESTRGGAGRIRHDRVRRIGEAAGREDCGNAAWG